MSSLSGISDSDRGSIRNGRPQVALLDTSVLFPQALRDTLLDLALTQLYVVRWSPTILDELKRNLVEHDRCTEDQAARLVASMNRVFPGAAVADYDSRIPEMTNHPKDRHVLAAAVRARADVIVTMNLRHFRSSALAPYHLAAQSPDQFLVSLATSNPGLIRTTLAEQAAGYQSPAISFERLLDRLALHAPTFVQRLREISK